MTEPVRIPSDVDREDRLVGALTARQLAILVGTAVALYGAWWLVRSAVAWPVFLAGAVLVAAVAVVLALGQRDGLSLDRLLLAALRQHLRPRRFLAAPADESAMPGWLESHTAHEARTAATGSVPLPSWDVTETGVIDLGPRGLAVVAAASTVNFALRTPGEQDGLVAAFGRYLHSLTTPVQIVVRTQRVDLATQITELRENAGSLPHPALEAAAREHADFLGELAAETDLLRRQVLLVFREAPHSATSAARRRRPRTVGPDAAARRAAEARLVRRLSEATELLTAAGITVTPLDADQARGVLAAACNPERLVPPGADIAGPHEVITAGYETNDEERP